MFFCLFVADIRSGENIERTAVDRHVTNKMTGKSLNVMNDIPPQYRERLKKNKPMYNAYIKSKV